MDIATKVLSALTQVLIAGLLLGAGLPALFALGIRALSGTTVATADGLDLTDGTRTTGANRPLAYVCFGACVLAVLFGIVVIVFGKQIFGR